MGDQMSRLGRMVDEALSEAGAADAPARDAGTFAGDYASPVRGGGAAYQAVEDICWIYMDRNLSENLRRHGWREARRNVMRQGPLDKEWTSHRGRAPVRLTRKGVQVKLPQGIQAFGWKRMQAQVRARRS